MHKTTKGFRVKTQISLQMNKTGFFWHSEGLVVLNI